MPWTTSPNNTFEGFGLFFVGCAIVQSMLRGLSEGDDIDELEETVDGYPDLTTHTNICLVA